MIAGSREIGDKIVEFIANSCKSRIVFLKNEGETLTI